MNLFSLPSEQACEEIFTPLVADKGILIEKIVSTGQASPHGFWYEQNRDEWVAVLQGEARLVWEDRSISEMRQGDWVLIPAGKKHRVDWTSTNPPCIWLAVHGNIL